MCSPTAHHRTRSRTYPFSRKTRLGVPYFASCRGRPPTILSGHFAHNNRARFYTHLLRERANLTLLVSLVLIVTLIGRLHRSKNHIERLFMQSSLILNN